MIATISCNCLAELYMYSTYAYTVYIKSDVAWKTDSQPLNTWGPGVCFWGWDCRYFVPFSSTVGLASQNPFVDHLLFEVHMVVGGNIHWRNHFFISSNLEKIQEGRSDFVVLSFGCNLLKLVHADLGDVCSLWTCLVADECPDLLWLCLAQA